jgi:Transposase
MGRRGYPPEFRRRVLDLIEAGRKIADVATDLGISDETDLHVAAPRPHRPRARGGVVLSGEGRARRGAQADP